MAYGVGDYTGDHAAEKTYIDLYRAMYDDWQTRFEPYQQILIDAATSTEMLDEQLARISATTDRTVAQAEQTAEMTRQRYGIQESATQAAANDSRMGINAGLAEVNAKNNARDDAYENWQNVMLGGTMRLEKPEANTGSQVNY
ncbi:hypothetical protein VoSk93_05130 [Vibrio owensii]